MEFSTARGRGRGGYRGRGRGQGRGGGRSDAKQSSGGQQGDKSHIQCHNCGKYGHMKANCWSKEKQANYAQEDEGESKLFREVHTPWICRTTFGSIVDSGCSKELDESYKIQVKLGDDKAIQVEGRGTVNVAARTWVF